jgi:cell division protein ZapE
MDTRTYVSVAERYEALCDAGRIERDGRQEKLARALDRVLTEVREKRVSTKSSALGWLFAKRRPVQDVPKGLYVFGGVGRGKTMMMDLFLATLPVRRKRRVHFHDFMSDVHGRIQAHRAALKRGEVKEDDPIPPVARAIHEEAWVLCFDEFSVTDIADAMILARLFEQLFKLGTVLVTTSNVHPDNLYREGLNRDLFLPFVDLLKTRVELFDLDGDTDYRLLKLTRRPVYMTPLDADADAMLDQAWAEQVEGLTVQPEKIKHRGREILVPAAANGAARFSFDDLCRNPLGASDYRAIAERYDTIFVRHVPVLKRAERNEAKRFIMLIDTLYDMKSRLVVSAAAEPDALYAAKDGTEGFEFARTASRLIEMQSADYLKESRERNARAA